MKKLIQRILYILAQRVIRKYTPKVVAITGSFGKTSTREAVALVLQTNGTVRQSFKNYNNEIGVPLTILGVESGKRSAWAWAKIILHGLRLSLATQSYPETLVLEYGMDRAGDIEYLVKLARPSIAVVTGIGDAPPHLEFFRNREQLIREKSEIIAHLHKEDLAILNADDRDVLNMAKKTRARVMTYGTTPSAAIFLREATVKGLGAGVHAKISFNETTVPMHFPHVIGVHQMTPLLAAICVGVASGINLVQIAEALAAYIPPPGRLRLIAGIKETTILDDTYNSSPAAAQAAIQTLKKLSEGRRTIAVLGDMNELGAITEREHEKLGGVVSHATDMLLTVGEKARAIAGGAIKHGMSKESVFSFADSKEAGLFLQERMERGDLILVKGSQDIRMERIVKEIMADPMNAKNLLVRQDAEWSK